MILLKNSIYEPHKKFNLHAKRFKRSARLLMQDKKNIYIYFKELRNVSCNANI